MGERSVATSWSAWSDGRARAHARNRAGGWIAALSLLLAAGCASGEQETTGGSFTSITSPTNVTSPVTTPTMTGTTAGTLTGGTGGRPTARPSDPTSPPGT